MESLEVTADFWAGRRVFVTGHTGFKGSWLVMWLRQMGAEVAGLSLAPSTKPNLFDVAEVGAGIDSRIADIRDEDAVRAQLRAAEPEVVFHLAAQPLVRYSYENPVETFQTNVVGTANLLNAVRFTPSVRAVVVVTTDKVYQNNEWDWPYREIDALGGHDPYSSSKAATELVTSSFRSSFFNPDSYGDHGVAIATARAGNVFGGGDWSADRLIPDIFRAHVADEVPVLRNPSSVRPWQYVLEPIRGYIQLAQALVTEGTKFSEAFNFGPDVSDVRSVGWIADELATLLGVADSWAHDDGSHPHEAQTLRLDISKVSSTLGWKPRCDLHAGLSLTADWHRAFVQGLDMREYSEKEIADYAQAR